jgi:hypothetical protein
MAAVAARHTVPRLQLHLAASVPHSLKKVHARLTVLPMLRAQSAETNHAVLIQTAHHVQVPVAMSAQVALLTATATTARQSALHTAARTIAQAMASATTAVVVQPVALLVAR